MGQTVQKPEKTCQRPTSSRSNSGCGSLFTLLALLAGFEHDRRARCGLRMEPLRPSGCFSAWLHRACRGAQLPQKCWQPPTNLRQRHGAAALLPGTVDGFDQWACGHQLVVSTSYHLGPAFRLLRRPKAGLIPQEHLFVEPKAMLVGVAQPIVRANLGQRRRFVALPDQPTDLGYLLNNSGREKPIIWLKPGLKRLLHSMTNTLRLRYPELLRRYRWMILAICLLL